VVVNAWRAKINELLDNWCPFFGGRVEEIEIHRFWNVPNLNELGIRILTSLIGFALGQVKRSMENVHYR
jgi:hypothetical protein